MDFSNAPSSDTVNQTVDEVIKVVVLLQPGSLLGLVDLSGCPINRETTEAIKRMAIHNKPFIRHIAIVGLPFPRSLGFKIMLRLTGRRNHRVFRRREGALEWLAGQGL